MNDPVKFSKTNNLVSHVSCNCWKVTNIISLSTGIYYCKPVNFKFWKVSKDISLFVCHLRPPGHHAEHDKCMGFCYFNNVAIAAKYAQSQYNVKKLVLLHLSTDSFKY